MKNSTDPKSQKEIFINEYRRNFASPYVAAEMGFVDEVIEPKETRIKLICALESLQNKKVKSPNNSYNNNSRGTQQTNQKNVCLCKAPCEILTKNKNWKNKIRISQKRIL